MADSRSSLSWSKAIISTRLGAVEHRRRIAEVSVDPDERYAVMIDDRAAARFSRGHDESRNRLGRGVSGGDAIADRSDAPRQTGMCRALLGHRRPSPRDVIDFVDPDEAADQCVRVAAQLDRPQVGIGFVRLHAARAQRHRGEHADHRDDPGPRRESWNDERSQRGTDHQQHDEHVIVTYMRRSRRRVKLLEVCDLVREDRGDFLGRQLVEQLFEEQHAALADRDHRERVGQPAALGTRTPYDRRRARAPRRTRAESVRPDRAD